jgi:molybdate transport system ATP-binding protein
LHKKEQVMSSLHISQGSFRLSDTRTLMLEALEIQAGDSWAFVGANGSGKSALARALADELVLLNGERHSDFKHAVRISFEQLQKLVSDEWQRNNTDLLSPGEEIPDAPQRKSFRKRSKTPRVARSWRSSSALPRCCHVALNTFLPAKRAKPCCVGR